MKEKEIQSELSMTYEQLVKYLLLKYGRCKFDYFTDSTCAQKTNGISRTQEGLFCHHIDEYRAIMLSNTEFAKNYSFEYQKASRLVYCNILEHLMLHIKIAEQYKDPCFQFGIGGAINFICPQINDYYTYNTRYEQKWLNFALFLIRNNYVNYIEILKMLLKIIESDDSYKKVFGKEDLCKDLSGEISIKIYNML